MKFIYRLSQKYADQQWVKTGLRPPITNNRSEEIPDEKIPEHYRRIITTFKRHQVFGVSPTDAPLTADGNTCFLLNLDGKIASFDHPLTPIDILIYISDEMVGNINAYQIVRQRDLDEAAQREAAKVQRIAEANAKKAHDREVMEAWINEHGSERLKKCQQHGYNCARLYWQERAKKEFPAYRLDYNNSATWDDRSGPTLAALTLLEQLQKDYPKADVEIVWLIDGPSSEVDADERESGMYVEAIRFKPASYNDNLFFIL